MRVVKILLGILASILAVLIIAAVAIVWLFDPNSYKSYITQYVEDRTGRQLEIADDLELSFFPWLAVQTGGITLSNAEGFGDRPFVSVDRVSARVKLMPLIRREFQVGTIVLDGVELNLARDAQGTGNWQDLLASSTESAADETSTEESSAIRAFNIEGVFVRGSRVVWLENSDEPRLVVSELNLQTDTIRPGRPVGLKLGFDALDVDSQFTARVDTNLEFSLDPGGAITATGVNVDFALKDTRQRERIRSRLELDSMSAANDGTLTLGSASIDSTLIEPPIGPAELPVRIAWRDAALEEADRFQFNGLVTSVAGIDANWRLAAQSLSESPRIEGLVTVQSGSVADLWDLLGLTTPAGVNRDELGNFDASADFSADLQSQHFALGNASMNVLGVAARAATATLDGPTFSADIVVPPFTPSAELRTLLEASLPSGIEADALDRLALRATVHADLDSGDIDIESLNAELAGATLTGKVSRSAQPGGSVFSGSIATNRFDSSSLEPLLSAQLRDSLGERNFGMLSLSAEFTYDTVANNAVASPVRLEILGLDARGELAASDVSVSPRVTGRARVAEFDPRQVMRRLGIEPPKTAGSSALNRATVETRFELTSSSGRLDDLLVMLDDNRITGSVQVPDFNAPSYRFTLNVDGIDVDRYLPPPAAAAAGERRRIGDLAIERAPLEAVSMQGTLSVGNLRLAGMSFQNLATSLSVGDGSLELASTHTNLYGGQFDGGVRIDASGEAPTLSLTGRTSNLNLEPLITALTGAANFTGTARFDIDLAGEGSTVADNLRSAAGTLGFELHDGVIEGVNVVYDLCTVYNDKTDRPAPPAQPKLTPYDIIQGTAKVTEGIATSSDLVFRNPDMQVQGGGRLDLADQTTDYKFEARILRSVSIPGCSKFDEAIGFDFPVDVKGPLTHPDIAPDYGEILRRYLGNELQERLRQLRQ